MRLGRPCCAAVLLLVWLSAAKLVPVVAGPYDPIWVEPASSSRAKIEKALDEPADFDFAETPLSKVVDSLHAKYAIEIQLDKKPLEEAGVAADTPITCKLKYLTLRSALRCVLFELDLTSVTRHDGLVITTAAQAETVTDVVIYPVDDLIQVPESHRPAGRQFQADYDSLIGLLMSMIAPTTWGEGNSQPIGHYHGTLLIPQTQEVHAEIAELLGQLRTVRDAQFAPPDNAGQTPTPTAAERRRDAIREALQQSVDFEFVDKPLSEIAEAIMEKCRVAIHLDSRALEEAGVETGRRVTQRLHGVKLRDALDAILRDSDLAWVVRDDVLIVTADTMGCPIPEARVYPIAGLGTPGRPAPHRPPMEEYDHLQQLITGLVAPASWSGGHGAIKAFPYAGALVVSQTSEEHEQIEQLLSSLRKIRGLDRAGAPAAEHAAAGADELVTLTYRLPGALGWRNEIATREASAEGERIAQQLAVAIVKHVEPATWGGAGGQGTVTVVGNQLLIRQRMAIHDRVADFLAKFNGFGNGRLGSF